MNGSGFTETPTESPSSKTLSSYIQRLDRFPEMHREGKVLQVIGHMVEATNPGCSVGGMCTIYNPADDSRAAAEVVGFRKDRMLVMPLRNVHGIGPRCRVIPDDRPPMVPVGEGLLGRVVDPLMRPWTDWEKSHCPRKSNFIRK